MLETERLDAVAIAVPPAAQYKIAKAAMAKGLHVFAEKPLAANLRQARELATIAKKRKIVHAMDFIFPEIPEWAKVKSLIDKKTYGSLKHISVNWDFLSYDIKNKITSWKTDVARGGGALSFYFSHVLYYLEHYAGKISRISSTLSYSGESLNGGDVGVDALLRFENGVTGYAHACCNARGLKRHQLVFICQRGTIILENQDGLTEGFSTKVYTEKKNEPLLVKQNIRQRNGEDERVGVVKKIAARFIKASAAGKQMKPCFTEGLRVQELIEKIRTEK